MTGAPHVTGLGAVAVDCADPAALATFWGTLLGASVTVDGDGDAFVRASGAPSLDFLRVPEAKSVKNRLHLDLTTSDLAAAVEEALSLGAVRADDVYRGAGWVVLRDPEGNEFCLLAPGVS